MYCRDGGIGRHARLKILWPLGRAGSIPAPGTNLIGQYVAQMGILFHKNFTRQAIKATFASSHFPFFHLKIGEQYVNGFPSNYRVRLFWCFFSLLSTN